MGLNLATMLRVGVITIKLYLNMRVLHLKSKLQCL